MDHLIVEFKARCADFTHARKMLATWNASFSGTDLQTDTYFAVPNGRLKLREGQIENNLIYYERANVQGLKTSTVMLTAVDSDSGLKSILSTSIGVKVVVCKKREIYFVDNVKIHLDEIDGLGSFIEVEAIRSDRNESREELTRICEKFLSDLEVHHEDLLEGSYSDMLEEKFK